jgi:hypothetical protein
MSWASAGQHRTCDGTNGNGLAGNRTSAGVNPTRMRFMIICCDHAVSDRMYISSAA